MKRTSALLVATMCGAGASGCATSVSADTAIESASTLGTCGGRFVEVARTAARTFSYAPEVRDFDGDGKADVAWIENTPRVDRSLRVAVSRNDGHGGFGAPLVSDIFGSHSLTRWVDFDGDGRLDLAIVDEAGTGLCISSQAADGTFGACSHATSLVAGAGTACGSSVVRDVVALDVTGDAKKELLVLTGTSLAASTPDRGGRIVSRAVDGSMREVCAGDPASPFSAAFAAAVAIDPLDADGDGATDILAKEFDGSYRLWLRRGSVFEAQPSLSFGARSAFVERVASRARDRMFSFDWHAGSRTDIDVYAEGATSTRIDEATLPDWYVMNRHEKSPAALPLDGTATAIAFATNTGVTMLCERDGAWGKQDYAIGRGYVGTADLRGDGSVALFTLEARDVVFYEYARP